MKKIEKKHIGKRSKYVSSAIISALVIGIMFGFVVLQSIEVVHDERGWHILFDGNLAQAAENDPGSGASGILEIFFANHTATPNTAYDENTSATIEGWCTAAGLGYANSDDFNVELAHSVDFDIAIKVRVNKTHAWDGAQFIDSWVRMNITSADLGIGADSAMTKVILTNDTSDNYIWLMFYYDFSGSGYDLSKDESADITSIKLQAYF